MSKEYNLIPADLQEASPAMHHGEMQEFDREIVELCPRYHAVPVPVLEDGEWECRLKGIW